MIEEDKATRRKALEDVEKYTHKHAVADNCCVLTLLRSPVHPPGERDSEPPQDESNESLT